MLKSFICFVYSLIINFHGFCASATWVPQED